VHPQRELGGDDRQHPASQDHPPRGDAGLRPCPVRREAGVLVGLVVRLSRPRHQRPTTPPESSGQLAELVAGAHWTSAIMIGGAWKYVIDAPDPTVSFAISSA